MIALYSYNNLTPEEYLQFEETSPIKHEYIDGQVYSMAGTTDTHNIVAGNIYTIIRNHLRGSNCRVYFPDVKVRLEKRNHFYYPDIIITCDDRDRETATYKRFPKLIVEVLSDSTEAFDRGDKFNDYQTLESLEEYKNLGITKVIIEEPLLNSNNIYTVQTLLRYNSFVTKNIYDVLGLVPEFISTYNSRKFAFPQLLQLNDKGKMVLFGGLPKDVDKKQIIWDLVAKREPQITWQYTRNNTLKKENFDQTDAYCAVLGFMNSEKIW